MKLNEIKPIKFQRYRLTPVSPPQLLNVITQCYGSFFFTAIHSHHNVIISAKIMQRNLLCRGNPTCGETKNLYSIFKQIDKVIKGVLIITSC